LGGRTNLKQHFEGLANGVYQRHPDYQDQSSIRIAVLNLLKPEMRIDGFIKQVEQQVERYGFAACN